MIFTEKPLLKKCYSCFSVRSWHRTVAVRSIRGLDRYGCPTRRQRPCFNQSDGVHRAISQDRLSLGRPIQNRFLAVPSYPLLGLPTPREPKSSHMGSATRGVRARAGGRPAGRPRHAWLGRTCTASRRFPNGRPARVSRRKKISYSREAQKRSQKIATPNLGRKGREGEQPPPLPRHQHSRRPASPARLPRGSAQGSLGSRDRSSSRRRFRRTGGIRPMPPPRLKRRKPSGGWMGAIGGVQIWTAALR